MPCIHCGKKLYFADRKALRKFAQLPYTNLLLSEIQRTYGSIDLCFNCLLHRYIVEIIQIKKLKTKKKLIVSKRKILRLSRLLRRRRLAQLARDDRIDRLYEGYERPRRPKRRRPKQIDMDEFVALMKQPEQEQEVTLISLGEFVQLAQKPPARRRPCWVNPPTGRCVYASRCSKADLCFGSITEMFTADQPRQRLPVKKTLQFYWTWDKCERNCLICRFNCESARNKKLHVRWVRDRKKPFRRRQKKAIIHRWQFLGTEGRPIEALIEEQGDYFLPQYVDAGGPPTT